MYRRQIAIGLFVALIANTLLVFSSAAMAQSLLDEPQPQLKGIAQTDLLHATAYLDGIRMSKHCRRNSSFRCVHLTVTNGSDEPMIVDGDGAEATDDKGNVVRVPTFDDVKHHTGCGLNAFDWTVLELVAFGTVGFGKILTEEWIEPHKDLGVAYGRDGWEHAVEVQRWGKIIITPGNTAEACLYFPRSQADRLQTVKLPVVSFTQSPSSGQLVVNVMPEAPPPLPDSSQTPSTTETPSTNDVPNVMQTTTQTENAYSTQAVTQTQTPDTKATSVLTTVRTPSGSQTTIKTTTVTPSGTQTTTQTTTQPPDQTTAPLTTPPATTPQLTPSGTSTAPGTSGTPNATTESTTVQTKNGHTTQTITHTRTRHTKATTIQTTTHTPHETKTTIQTTTQTPSSTRTTTKTTTEPPDAITAPIVPVQPAPVQPAPSASGAKQ